jgi:tetratricopeptide (TPR) repeat protein
MKRSLPALLLVICLPWRALAGACSGAETQIALASKALTVTSVETADKILRDLSVSHPDCIDIVLQKARLAQAQGNYVDATDLFYRYTDADPDNSRGLAFFGRFFLDQKDYMRAEALSAAAVAKNPDDPVALALRGEILIMKGQRGEGQPLLEKAVRLDPDDPGTHFQLGVLYDKAKSAPNAVQHFRKVVALTPGDARAWDYLALNLEPLGDIDGADQAYRKGLEVNQRGAHYDAFLDYNYGRFLAKRNQFSASKHYLDRAVESTPQIRAVWYERARLDLRMQNYQQARKDAEKSAACTEEGGIIDLQIYSLLSQVYSRLGETALARKYIDLTRETPPPVRGENR